MFKSSFYKIVFAAMFLAAAGISVMAQTAPVAGRVVLQKADGTSEPIPGALVEVYRVDVKSTLPSDKTNKKGEFGFAGLPLGATFVLSISAPGAKPGYLPNVKAGQDKLLITLTEGDGRRWSEEEVRQAISTSVTQTDPAASAKQTADQKKAEEEYKKKVAEVEAKNKDIANKNTVVQKSLSEGNAAFEQKNFDVAIARYSEGIDVDPEYVGSAPILLNNKAIALRSRGLITYNQAVKQSDASAKAAGVLQAKKDFADSVDAYGKSITVIKNAPAADVVDPKTAEAAKIAALRGIKESLRLMAETRQVDEAVMPKAAEFLPQYMAIETDAAKKAEAQLVLADLYRVAGDSENAIVAYKKALEVSPDNVDALAGLGLSLVNAGYVDGDKNKLQEGANVLQRFASLAPDTHKYKDDALGLIQTLKAEQNVTPQKTAPAKKKN